jgi:hypothetical protein
MKPLVIFPVANKQTCSNCRVSLNMDKLLNNVIHMTEDASGIPAVIVRCPVCKTLIEWETLNN